MEPMMGRAWVYGDYLDTDAICPARALLSTSDPQELAKHGMEPVDPEFFESVQAGDFLVAGRNAGFGSSREQAPLALKSAGIAIVIAQSFARLFCRGRITLGLPALRCPGVHALVSHGDTLQVQSLTGRVRNVSSAQLLEAEPLEEPSLSIVLHEGLIGHLGKGGDAPRESRAD